MISDTDVVRLGSAHGDDLVRLCARYDLSIIRVDPGMHIPSSFWGDEEAGLAGRCIYARADTPVHSILHETGHFVCMDAERRAALDTNAGGDDLEEMAVCYLQILLADSLDLGRKRMCADMDAWGYSFRLGSAAAWFDHDAEDARAWLRDHGIIDGHDRPTGQIRT